MHVPPTFGTPSLLAGSPGVPRSCVCLASASGGSMAASGGARRSTVPGGGSGGETGKPDAAVLSALSALGRPLGSFPPDFRAAVEAGQVGPDVLRRYLDLESKLVIGWLMNFSGFRERFLADPSFLVKLGIEVGVGVCTKMTAEYTKRQGSFYQELDFVAANVLMAILADFMLVWLPAPTYALAHKQASKTNLLGRFFEGVPDNAFQVVQPGMAPFSLAQRFKAPLRNGLKLFGVGVGASFVGVIVTNTLVFMRTALDADFVPLNQPQNVLATSLAYGVYMATSSNIRYQILAGLIEERGIEARFRGNYRLCAALSFFFRTSNTFIGSLLWVDFVRLLGMQTAAGH